MFNYTRTAFNKIVNDIKKLMLIINASIIVGSIAYLSHSLIVGTGNVYANTALCTLTVMYLVFFILKTKKLVKKGEFSTFKHVYKAMKLSVNALILVIAVYGIITGVESGASAIKTYVLLAFWIVQVILELLTIAIEKIIKMFTAALKKDASAVIKLLNVFRKNDIELPEEDDEYIMELDKLIEKDNQAKSSEKRGKVQIAKEKIASVFVKK